MSAGCVRLGLEVESHSKASETSLLNQYSEKQSSSLKKCWSAVRSSAMGNNHLSEVIRQSADTPTSNHTHTHTSTQDRE